MTENAAGESATLALRAFDPFEEICGREDHDCKVDLAALRWRSSVEFDSGNEVKTSSRVKAMAQ